MTFCVSELIQGDRNGDMVSFPDSAGVKPIMQAWQRRAKEESQARLSPGSALWSRTNINSLYSDFFYY